MFLPTPLSVSQICHFIFPFGPQESVFQGSWVQLIELNLYIKTVKQDKAVYWWASAASIGVFNETEMKCVLIS